MAQKGAMPKSNSNRQQIGVRLYDDAIKLLSKLQQHYANKAGLREAISQSDAVDRMIKDTAKREGVK